MTVTMDGRATAFATLYEQHYGAVHAYASRRVGADAAGEVAAETFLIAWRRCDAVPGEPLPWLYGVAGNVALRHHEANRRQTRAREAAERERPVPARADAAGDPAVWEAWNRLRPGDREVLALIAWEELSVAEAARVLGCPASQFSVRLFRARRRLERLLASAPEASPAESSDRTEVRHAP
jgi:RNA polymerase sigma-70 factor (ECF subfamily)